MEGFTLDEKYLYLRHCREIDLSNECYYRELLDSFYIPFQDTLYGEVLIHLGQELNRSEPIMTLQDCVEVPGVVFFDICYMMDLGEAIAKWANSRSWELC